MVYWFGKVDWGDNSQQELDGVFNSDVSLNHPYPAEKTYVIHGKISTST